MVKILIDNEEVEVNAGSTIMEACAQKGVSVPHFCYHPDLSIAGNCRMCLVEVEKMPKPIAGCAFPVQEGMVIKTNSEMVEKARKGVLELLLINHPLDCPVCDQGGECGLQDQAVGYGKGCGDYEFERRLVSSKNMGPLIKTVMTRCIHCTRCIRFMDEIAGTSELGAVYRGEETEITTYLESNITSELSGNLIDICPVGALTSHPYAFQGRAWELLKIKSIDVLDAVGSNIELHVRENNVMRIVPFENREINDCWIGDKIRFSYDGFSKQRLDRPYIRQNKKLEESTWEDAFTFIKNRLKDIEPNQMAALSGGLTDAESAFALKEFMSVIGSPHLDSRPIKSYINPLNLGSYLFNSTIEGIDQSDCILLVGTNPKIEALMINTRIRKRFLKGNIKIALIGEECDLTYDFEHLGNSAQLLKEILDKKHPFSKQWFKAKKPMMIIGESALLRRDSNIILKMAQDLCEKANAFNEEWNGFNVLLSQTGIINGLETGFIPGKGGYSTEQILQKAKENTLKVLYLLNIDTFNRKDFGDDVFVIYQGHHGDKGAESADVILPGLLFTEKDASYVNCEGRVQQTNKAVEGPYLAKEDWKIIRALASFLNVRLTFDTLEQVRQKMGLFNKRFFNPGKILKMPLQPITVTVIEHLSNAPFETKIKNYYMTDVISRHSKTMATCTLEFQKKDFKTS
ncbi:MAG: NADH-quinone oxidoreductase subunit G [Proteobacteria bacterium]|nr:NADH-quinone oxidoreductase subunit G [Pseudomonadota bacterium]